MSEGKEKSCPWKGKRSKIVQIRTRTRKNSKYMPARDRKKSGGATASKAPGRKKKRWSAWEGAGLTQRSQIQTRGVRRQKREDRLHVIKKEKQEGKKKVSVGTKTEGRDEGPTPLKNHNGKGTNSGSTPSFRSVKVRPTKKKKPGGDVQPKKTQKKKKPKKRGDVTVLGRKNRAKDFATKRGEGGRTGKRIQVSQLGGGKRP